VIIVIMRYDHSINQRDVLDLAWCFSIALGTEPAKGRAAVLEDWVEENAESTRELNVIARMA
jgi:hypothetical protein